LKSPLFIAIENGQGAAAEKLLDAGADPRLQDDLGRSVVEVGKFKLPQDWYQKLFDRLNSDSENDYGTSPAEEFLQKKLESKSDAEFNDMVTRVN
jgi:ankyrin repeat protein